MKKVLVYGIFALFVWTGCSGTKNYSEETARLNTWASAVKNRDYSMYKKIEANPRSVDQFNEMYKEYYLESITVVKVEESSKDLKTPEGKEFSKKTVTCGGEIIIRANSKKTSFRGVFDMIQYTSPKSDWLIAGRTIIRND